MSSFILEVGIFKTIGDWLKNILIDISLLIDSVIYQFINWMYRIFKLITEVDIFGNNSDLLNDIIRRLYIIVGIAMLFIFAYNLILLVINPEGKQLGDMGKVVKNAVISIILVTLLPLIFTSLTTMQKHILDEDIIGNIVFGGAGNNALADSKKAGTIAALNIFAAFYHPVDGTYWACGGNICQTYQDAYNEALNTEKITDFILNKDLKEATKDGDMDYMWILSTAAGLLALWCFVSFSIDMGVRVGKLAFYQIISPVPVMMRIMPNDKMFDKWFKGIKDTYLSVFLRILVIDVCMLAISLVPKVFQGMSGGNDNVILQVLAIAFVIIGILQFAKEAPKLISDLFSSGSGSLNFGIGNKVSDAFRENPILRPVDMIRSANYAKKYGQVTQDVLDEDGNVIGQENVNTGGWWRGLWRGRNGYESGTSTTDALIERRQSGATLGDVVEDKARVAAGLKTAYEEQDFKEKQALLAAGTEEMKESNKELKESIESLEDSIKNAIEKASSKVEADLGGFGKYIDENGEEQFKYELKGNLTKMNEVYEQAIRDKADGATLREMNDAIKKWKKDTSQDMRDKSMSGRIEEIVNVSADLKHTMKLSAEDINDHMEKKGISTYDYEKEEWVVNHNINIDENGHYKIGDLKEELSISNADINEKEKNIKSEIRNRYKAKKGSSDWTRRSRGSSKGSSK